MTITPIRQGSPKQIAWAEDLRAKIVADLDDLRGQIPPEAPASTTAILDEVRGEMINAEGEFGSAIWWIENRLTAAIQHLRDRSLIWQGLGRL